MHVFVTLKFVRILCILVTDGRMVEFNSSICQVGHTDIGQMEGHILHYMSKFRFSHMSMSTLPFGGLPYVCAPLEADRGLTFDMKMA